MTHTAPSHPTPSHRTETLRQLLRFAAIGTAGIFVDWGALSVATHVIGLNLYYGRIFSWFVAATFTWAMNRRFTFADNRPAMLQWLVFLAANSVGGVVNNAVYDGLVAFVPLVAAWPVLGIAAGSVAGLFFNFTASKWVVFRRTRHAAP